MQTKSNLIALGSVTALVGFIFSGPVSFLFLIVTNLQPAWTSSADFAAQYNSLQNIPYYFGFLLVGGILMLMAAHYLDAGDLAPRDKMHVLLSVVWATIFATLIFFNYICQTTFVHHLALQYKPAYDTIIATLSMANPASLSWAIEMWGYAFLGIATWLLASYYKGKNKTIYFLLILNGIVSVLSVIAFVINGAWLLTTTGLICYTVWNALMIVLLVFIYAHSRKAAKMEKANYRF
jgi:hypothetical protein